MFETSGVVTAGAARPTGAPVLDALTDVADRLRGVVAEAQSAQGWDGAVRARVVRALDQVASLVTAARGPVLVAQHAAAARVGGERSFVDTRARLTGTTRFGAAREVAAAQAMGRLPVVGSAVAEHAMPPAHLEVIGQTLTGASPRVAQVLEQERTQEQLVELARQTDARQFSRHVAALVAEHDPQQVEDEHEAARRARFLTMSHGPRGTSLKGFLDPLAGQVLARTLDATGHREDDERTRDQARADALTALAQHALGAGVRAAPAAGAPGPGVPPDAAGTGAAASVDGATQPDGAVSAPAAHVSLLVPAETWVEVQREQRRRRSGPARARTDAAAARTPDRGESRPARATGRDDQPARTPDEGATWPARETGAGDRPAQVPPAVSDDGTVLSRTELAAALCDCAMTRVVMDAQGLPLDVGRARRMFTPAQRVAVVARDRQCAWNGCSVAARYCHLHHVRWWHRDGGRSDLENAVLLCSHHHHLVHALDLDVTRVPPAGAPPPGPPDRTRAAPPRGTAAGWAGARYVFRDRRGRVHNGLDRHPPPDRALPSREPGPGP